MDGLKYIIESTIQQLASNTERAFGDDREDSSSLIKVTAISIIQYDSGIEVKCKVHNSESQNDYNASILFEGIPVGSEGEFDLDIMTVTGDLISVKSSDIDNTDVKVKCSCLDFYWRFAMWNFNDGSLLGTKPKPYVKKTNRPPNNPQRIPGLCKHLMSVKHHFEQITRQ